jgi:hypothetical protein
VKCVKLFINLSFNHQSRDDVGRTIACFAAAEESFDICWEVQNLGMSFGRECGQCPARFTAEFGRLDVLQWLWTLPG